MVHHPFPGPPRAPLPIGAPVLLPPDNRAEPLHYMYAGRYARSAPPRFASVKNRKRGYMQELHETNRLLKLFAVQSTKKEDLDAVIGLLREWTGARRPASGSLDREGKYPLRVVRRLQSGVPGVGKSSFPCTRDGVRLHLGWSQASQGAKTPLHVTGGGGFHCGDIARYGGGALRLGVQKVQGQVQRPRGTQASPSFPISYRTACWELSTWADREGQEYREDNRFHRIGATPIGEAIHRFKPRRGKGASPAAAPPGRRRWRPWGRRRGASPTTSTISSQRSSALRNPSGGGPRGQPRREDPRADHRRRPAGAGTGQADAHLRPEDHLRKETLAAFQGHRETMALVRASIPSTVRINMKVESESSLVMGDLNQIQQVLMNLCTNGADAMRRRGAPWRWAFPTTTSGRPPRTSTA